ncbi:hypothetical protein AVEN_51323-1 [Araneus ventricosus]|uniref:Uncharacterized protein n=1 Tax=Araneus ventricosus TaxID=182803 RepID=A0A4Y2NZQ9_ARAVE|nr:hypothetical protein AVEN_51323-1 [Araneus ventricosus]
MHLLSKVIDIEACKFVAAWILKAKLKALDADLETVRFPSREQRSHEKKSAAHFDIGGKQQDSCTWTSLTRRRQAKELHTEDRHNAEESITVGEHISGTLWYHS